MFDPSVYSIRRSELIKNMSSGIILMPGNEDSPMNYKANNFRFRQDSSFLYFFGADRQGLTGLMDIDENKSVLFGDDDDINDIIWMGDRPSVRTLADKAGVVESHPLSELVKILKHAVDKGRKIHYLPPYHAEKILRIEKWIGTHHSGIEEQSSTELIRTLVKMRSAKSAGEIEEIEKAIDIAGDMHVTAMKMAFPGIYEREIAGKIEGISLAHGNPVPFPVILSINGQTLHNHYHGNRLEKGKIMVTDAGSESDLHYASDITRSVPVGGKFTSMQKDIYSIVLHALNQSIESIRPGIPYREIHLQAAGIIADGLTLLGIMKGDAQESVAAGAHALFFPHGLGHMLGLDVHDMEDLGENYVGYDDEIKRSDQFGLAFLRLGRRLEKNFVVTVEPGIYFIPALIDKWKSEKVFTEFINYDKLESCRNFGGIRIEDDVMVTETGSRVLGRPIPRTISEIEEIMTRSGRV
jgi:Xaa-Pro aminopeptidase